MISPEKFQSALRALNTVLVLARAMAYAGAAHKEIADVLDTAEYLPRLMAESVDRTAMFREYLEDLARRWPSFGLAVADFDDPSPRNKW